MSSSFPIVTVATRNYLHQVRALAASLAETNPDVPLYVCFADRPPAGAIGPGDRFQVIFAEELGIPEWRRFSFQYTPFELSCALKPYALDAVLGSSKADGVIFVDADVQFYGPLAPLRGPLAGASIVVTPHLLAPARPDCAVTDYGILRAGPYNMGFVGIRRSPAGARFLAWWKSKMRRECIMSLADGLFVDQAWSALLPAMFEGVEIERDPGLNVAYFNLAERRIERDASGSLRANGEPLVFFHFSGFQSERPTVLSRHDTKTDLAGLPVVREILAAYVDLLERCGRAECGGWGTDLDRLGDGTSIDERWREAVRMNHPLLAGIADPFDAAATPDLVDRFRRAEPDARANRADWRIADSSNAYATSRARVLELERVVHQLEDQRAALAARFKRIEDHPVIGPIIRLRRRLKTRFGST